jgi:hypothetical protein
LYLRYCTSSRGRENDLENNSELDNYEQVEGVKKIAFSNAAAVILLPSSGVRKRTVRLALA